MTENTFKSPARRPHGKTKAILTRLTAQLSRHGGSDSGRLLAIKSDLSRLINILEQEQSFMQQQIRDQKQRKSALYAYSRNGQTARETTRHSRERTRS